MVVNKVRIGYIAVVVGAANDGGSPSKNRRYYRQFGLPCTIAYFLYVLQQ